MLKRPATWKCMPHVSGFQNSPGAIKRVSEFQNSFQNNFSNFKMKSDGPAAAQRSFIISSLDLFVCVRGLIYCIHSSAPFHLSHLAPCRQHLESLPFALASSNAKRASASHRRPPAQAVALAQSPSCLHGLASMVLLCGAATPRAWRRVFFGLVSTIH
jgi:hypothetical protein